MLMGIFYEKLIELYIVFIDVDGQYEQGKLFFSEWCFYMVVYQMCFDVNVVVYNYVVYCMVVLILNCLILVIYYMIVVVGGNFIFCVFYVIFGICEFFDYVVVVFKNCKVMLLQYYGFIVCEENLDKVLWLVYEVEVLVQFYLSMLVIVDLVLVLDDEVIVIVLEKFKIYGLCIEE